MAFFVGFFFFFLPLGVGGNGFGSPNSAMKSGAERTSRRGWEERRMAALKREEGLEMGREDRRQRSSWE